VVGWKYGEGGDEQAGQEESDYNLDPQVKRLQRRRLLGARKSGGGAV